MRLMRAIAIAFSTYSRIPMPRVDWSEENQRYSMCFFPLVGLAVGLAPVSYTHLDVYKRQCWKSGAFARGWQAWRRSMCGSTTRKRARRSR